jgi:hypothetical protein
MKGVRTMTEGGSVVSIRELVTAVSVYIEAGLTILGQWDPEVVIGQLEYSPTGPGPCPTPLPNGDCLAVPIGTVTVGDAKQVFEVLQAALGEGLQVIDSLEERLG